ncbi:GAF domain-containing protein [Stenotrophomonas sp.]|uniref:GAF domain-containing protein n=1 Tax=Stenotrophomonas sp. TaxID=69392 RepID=UPI00289F9356|nr:GAF domain-containing protein [Stenotrophomonas sp.]
MTTGTRFPTVIGFDLPGQQDAPGGSRVIITAILDGVPPDDWMLAFHREAGRGLRETFAVEQIRLVGEGLHFVGAITDARGLSAAVRGLVERVTAQVLDRRLAVLDNLIDESNWGPGAGNDDTPPSDPRMLDVAQLQAMPAVPGILALASDLTAMRFVAVARVTSDRWTTCAVRDLLGFGLAPGQDLVLETTICHEIRQHQMTVQFNQASEHPVFSRHHTPAMYGFESYISVPVRRRDGSFFGTLCALDPLPSRLDAAGVACFEVMGAAIGAHLDLDEGASNVAAPSVADVLGTLATRLQALEPSANPAVQTVLARLRALLPAVAA